MKALILTEKEKRIEEINSHGDTMTHLMNTDRKKYWHKYKQLQGLRDKMKHLVEQVESDLDAKIQPIE